MCAPARTVSVYASVYNNPLLSGRLAQALPCVFQTRLLRLVEPWNPSRAATAHVLLQTLCRPSGDEPVNVGVAALDPRAEAADARRLQALLRLWIIIGSVRQALALFACAAPRPSSGVSWRNLRDRRVLSIEVCRLAAKGAGMQLQVCKNCLSKTSQNSQVYACGVYASRAAESDPSSPGRCRVREQCRRRRRRGRVRHRFLTHDFTVLPGRALRNIRYPHSLCATSCWRLL